MTKINFVILAAGKGTSMRSALPKVLHKLSGRSMLGHVVAVVESLGEAKKIIVTGHGAEQVEQQFKSPTTIFTQQKEQLGTGHAVHMAVPELCSDAVVIVLYGDVPLIRPATIQKILAVVTESAMGLLTINLDQPTGYGRIVRNTSGDITEIIEQKDASVEQLKITEVNTGVLALQSSQLRDWLPKITNNNAQGEYYLTDLVAIAREAGIEVISVNPESATEVEGVNNRVQLSQLERAHQRQLAEVLMESGTSLADPARFDQRGELSAGTDNFIDINCVFNGSVTIGSNVSIGANCQISDSTIGDGVSILPNTIIESSVVGVRAVVGPFARLRPGTEMGSDTKVGNFVETKKTKLGDGAKANHLAYLGDAEIGDKTNIGAGTITCNYDGTNKHKTTIGEESFIGTNSSLVAPVNIGKGAYVGAGSVITKDVPDEALAVGRGKQVTKEDWAKNKK